MSHFKEKEFACKCGECTYGFNHMSKKLIYMLNDAREKANIPFVITSGFRCETHNKNEGGSETSSHPEGFAVDIKAKNSQERFKILEALILAGFTRIGIAKTFIHVDVDPNKPNQMVWVY